MYKHNVKWFMDWSVQYFDHKELKPKLAMLTLKTTAPIIHFLKWLRVSTFQPSNAARLSILHYLLQECHILWSMNIKGAYEYRTAMDKTKRLVILM